MPANKAVLVGCNYPGTNAALRGCINDVWGVKALLTEFYGFADADILVLIDTDKAYMQPTGKNIKAQLGHLVQSAADGDVLVFHFSGHGTQIPSYNAGDEADGKDEAICPTDMNVITDDDLRTILKPLEGKPNCKFTFIADCCHSGTLLDHQEVQISGAKDGAPPPPQLDLSALAGMFLGSSDGRDLKNRALPFNDLCGMLSSLLGGQEVNARNVRASMGSVFGGDASAKIQQFMQIAQAMQSTAKNFGGGGAGGAGGGGQLMSGLLGMLFSCLQPQPQAAGQGAAGQAAPAPHASNPLSTNQGAAGHATAPPANGNLAEPQLDIVLPAAGSKPPPSAQLSEEVGILITGCQSSETSADACPSGDPNKAHGALSNAIQTVVRQHFAQAPGTPLTYRNLVIGVREMLLKTGFSQNPCLECSDRNADSAFIVH